MLLVSTDPASNLDEVLETKLTNEPKTIAGAAGLHAMNINPVEAAAKYRERLIGPCAVSFLKPRSAAWKNSFLVPARSRSRRSMSSQDGSEIPNQPGNTTMSFSIPHRSVTPFV